MIYFIKSLFCSHKNTEVIDKTYLETVYRCKKCGRVTIKSLVGTDVHISPKRFKEIQEEVRRKEKEQRKELISYYTKLGY